MASAAAPFGAAWSQLGPQYIAGLSTYGSSAGRVTAVAANGSTVYAGSADGGVWKSLDGGKTWAPKTDSQPTLAIGAIAVRWGVTSATDSVYAGTGEGNHCQDCLPSLGIMKSTDGGATWSAPVSLGSGTYYLNALVIDQANPQRVLAASTAGLYESTDGGTTWVLRKSGRYDMVVQDPAVANHFWASRTTSCTAPTPGEIGVWDTSAQSWTSLWNGAAPALPVDAVRIGLDVGPNRTAYAAVAACGEGQFADGQSEGILKTIDGGTSWSVLNPPDYFSVGSPPEAQGWYDNVVAIDPNDGSGDTAVFGGITMLATTDGGISFTDIAQPYGGGPLHPDFHAVAFTDYHSFYAGNDGGVYFTTDLGGTGSAADWTNDSSDLRITQFYQGSSVDLTHVAGGTQDNGTTGNPLGAAPAPWKSLLDGDGFWTAMIPGQSRTFGEVSGLDIYQFDYSGTGTQTEVAPCPSPYNDPSCTDPTGFNAPFVIDPTSSTAGSARLYAGTNRVYRTASGGLPSGRTTSSGAWTAISGDLTLGPGGTTRRDDFINTMAIGSGSTSSTVLTGSWYGKVSQTNVGPTASASSSGSWLDITGNLPAWSTAADSRNPWITGVEVNPVDRTEAWVTIGTLTGPRIFHTNNATALPQPTVWTDISATLPPSLVIDSVTVDPIKPQNVYIGTDAGAMVCTTCGGAAASVVANWVPLGTGLPNVRVSAISLTSNDVDLVAWTHGRGAWTIKRPIPTPGAALQPSSLEFGNQTVHTTSPPKIATLSSSGTGPLTVSNIALGGSDLARTNAGQTNPCVATPFVLVPGTSCTIGVTFTPTITQAETGSLTVTDDAADSPQTIPVNGTGVPPQWVSLAGSLTSSPAATSWGSGRLDVFARGRDLALYHTFSSNSGANWTYWERLGGTLSSDPVAVSWGTNRLDVFARGQDLALYHMSWDGTTWTYWERLGGTLASNPTASTWGVGRLDLYAAGQDKALYHMWTANSGTLWNPWTKLGGTLSSDPAAASWGSNRLDVFAAGQDKALYHMWSTDGGIIWQPWFRLGGTLNSSPSATSWGPTRIDLVALGQDRGMYHMWSNDGSNFNSGWQPEFGVWTLNPTVTSSSHGWIDMFARGTDTALWHKAVFGS